MSADPWTIRWRRGLVAVESAIATFLLIATILLLMSLWRLLTVPLGFEAEQILTFELRLLDLKYWPPGQLHPRQRAAGPMGLFQNALVDRVRALPGVQDVGATSAVPFRGVDPVYSLNRIGERRRYSANARFVDAGYFAVMRIGLVRGRLFTSADTATSPKVIVISGIRMQLDVRCGRSLLGKFIDVGEPAEVVGVVGDVRYQAFGEDPAPGRVPFTDAGAERVGVPGRCASGNRGELIGATRRIIHEIDPALPAMKIATVDQILSDSIADRRFNTITTSAFGFLAFLLAIVGLAVVTARFVIEKRRDLAIRTALEQRQAIPPALSIGTG